MLSSYSFLLRPEGIPVLVPRRKFLPWGPCWLVQGPVSCKLWLISFWLFQRRALSRRNSENTPLSSPLPECFQRELRWEESVLPLQPLLPESAPLDTLVLSGEAPSRFPFLVIGFPWTHSVYQKCGYKWEPHFGSCSGINTIWFSPASKICTESCGWILYGTDNEVLSPHQRSL